VNDLSKVALDSAAVGTEPAIIASSTLVPLYGINQPLQTAITSAARTIEIKHYFISAVAHVT